MNIILIIAGFLAITLLPSRIVRAMRHDYLAKGYGMSRCKRAMLALRNIFSL